MFQKPFLISVFIALLVFTAAFTADDVTTRISNAIQAGNATELSEHFNDNIRLKIEDNDYIYSRNQAKVILKDFFARNQPDLYKITSVRKTGNTNIIIGSMTTGDRNFRVYYQLSDNRGDRKINYFDIQSIIN